ncbi:helix-turn-helix transcriptional regulator [Streptomyces poonensis]|uniref:Transcriptional regulator n=1 Tax=Streptomyces poonensis TaxID=68255 RepID=A0A918QBM4_9ACTN|nr:AraC family transcriptional regulator [Streptomyces poonensis]GGZ41047.1 transcriptional regulator [Streptomyces poonensis]GLJ91745.1 transcriptional regulator [Streptomyces poonensis]
MKKNGQITAGRSAAAIPAVAYRPTPGRPPGLEVLDLPGLAARADERELPLTAPARPAFHLIIALRSGRLECSVDFTSYVLGPGDWLWVWPGQVLQFPGGHGDGDATALVFPSGFPSSATDALIRDGEHVPDRLVTPDPARRSALDRLLDTLVEEHAGLSDLALEAYIETLRNLLSVILIRLVHLADPRRQTQSGTSEPFHLFRRAVEEDFGRTHRVEDYAARLGYSPRTLTRATRAALGCGAKRYIDDRVLLEAKRLLIHTALPPATISERIGFAYPTVFSAFFRQHTGMTPTEFRSLTKP